jgi:hypothetical protein
MLYLIFPKTETRLCVKKKVKAVTLTEKGQFKLSTIICGQVHAHL